MQYLVSYYERLGFKCIGKSPAEFGGGGWHDMVSHTPKASSNFVDVLEIHQFCRSST